MILDDHSQLPSWFPLVHCYHCVPFFNKEAKIFKKEAEEITHAFPKNQSKLNEIIFHVKKKLIKTKIRVKSGIIFLFVT